MNALKNPLALLGRVLLAVFFIPAGFGKIAGFAGTVGYATAMGLPLPQVGVAIALVVEIVGGLALLVGFQTRYAALALALALALAFFTLVASYFFHGYWALPADQQMMQQLMFFKNIGVIGGLLAFAAHGAGGFSLDARRSA